VPLTVHAISEIAARLVREQGRALDVTITSTHGGSDRVELLVVVADWHRNASRVLLNVSRADQRGFERELRGRLANLLATRRGPE
jgi:hypothetical protein